MRSKFATPLERIALLREALEKIVVSESVEKPTYPSESLKIAIAALKEMK